MTGTALGPAWTTCPACGLPLKHNRAVCSGCGAITPFERVGQTIGRLGRQRIRKWSGQWRRIDVLMWMAALTPLLILPPVLALLVAWRRHAVERDPAFDATWIALAALANIAFSAIVLVKFGNELHAILGWLTHATSFRWSVPHEKPVLTPI